MTCSMFDWKLCCTLSWLRFLAPNIIIPLAVRNNVNSEQVPTVFFSNVASTTGSVVEFHVHINKPDIEAVTGLAISVVYNNTKVSAFNLSNIIIFTD